MDDFLRLLEENSSKEEKIVFFGDGISAYEDRLSMWSGNFEFAPENIRFQTADRIARLGYILYQQGVVVDAFLAKPNYLRQSEAERKLLAK